MTYTGGPLNELNGKMGISAPSRSVPIMKLIRTHKPLSKDALVQLIEYHYYQDCSCGIISQGTIEMFGHNLYHAQMRYWNEKRFSLMECIQWEYDLFVVQSLKGGNIEYRAIELLNKSVEDLQFKEAEGYMDEELRVDILVLKNGRMRAGIQVKPLTYRFMREEVKLFNTKANTKWGKPVLYFFYDKQENFVNLAEITETLMHF